MDNPLGNPLSVEMSHVIREDEILHCHRALGSKGHRGGSVVHWVAMTGGQYIGNLGHGKWDMGGRTKSAGSHDN